jgi:hypothetical protein
MDQRTTRRLAALLTVLTVLAALATAVCVGLALIPRDGEVLPLLISAAVTVLLGGATILLLRRVED